MDHFYQQFTKVYSPSEIRLSCIICQSLFVSYENNSVAKFISMSFPNRTHQRVQPYWPTDPELKEAILFLTQIMVSTSMGLEN